MWRENVYGHFLIQDANSFLRAKMKGNCKLRGTGNVQGQVYEHVFCKIEAIVLIILQIFCNAREEMFMNKQIYPSFCSNHKTLSHLDLKLKR